MICFLLSLLSFPPSSLPSSLLPSFVFFFQQCILKDRFTTLFLSYLLEICPHHLLRATPYDFYWMLKEFGVLASFNARKWSSCFHNGQERLPLMSGYTGPCATQHSSEILYIGLRDTKKYQSLPGYAQLGVIPFFLVISYTWYPSFDPDEGEEKSSFFWGFSRS